MSEAEDPAEKLLADALKAQARSAPSEPAPLASTPGPAPSPSEPSLAADPGPPPPGLFSGSGSMPGLAAPAPLPVPMPGLHGQMPPPSYGLLSGADASSLERERAALDAEAPTNGIARPEPTQRTPVRRPLAAYWILLVAVLLGLAAGSIIGLLTLV